MTRYFFDIDDGHRRTVDREGHDLASRAAVRQEAIGVLPGVAADLMPDGDHTTVRVQVRDEAGRPVFHASLTLASGWLV